MKVHFTVLLILALTASFTSCKEQEAGSLPFWSSRLVRSTCAGGLRSGDNKHYIPDEPEQAPGSTAGRTSATGKAAGALDRDAYTVQTSWAFINEGYSLRILLKAFDGADTVHYCALKLTVHY